MSLRPRSEITAIRKHIDSLKQAIWLGPARSWWPDYLFHCTDIQNIVSVLKTGELLSRVQANKTGQLQIDIAAPDIIEQTNAAWQDYVRLYFRPRTPTQFRNEGFRPMKQREYNSHCPVPVYLLFNAHEVLSQADSIFTDGNVAANATPMSTIKELQQVPFQLIYHDSSFEPRDRSTIVYHRNAEVLVPQRLGLGALRAIVCRSQAEYDTLMHLLPPSALAKWVGRIGLFPNWRLFHNRWTFVQQVDMSDQRLLFKFNENSNTPGPFDARLEIIEPLMNPSRIYRWQKSEFQAKDDLGISLRNLGNL